MLIESVTPCHDAQRCWWDWNPIRLTVSGLQHGATTPSNTISIISVVFFKISISIQFKKVSFSVVSAAF